jgi:hypothetical protein
MTSFFDQNKEVKFLSEHSFPIMRDFWDFRVEVFALERLYYPHRWVVTVQQFGKTIRYFVRNRFFLNQLNQSEFLKRESKEFVGFHYSRIPFCNQTCHLTGFVAVPRRRIVIEYLAVLLCPEVCRESQRFCFQKPRFDSNTTTDLHP